MVSPASDRGRKPRTLADDPELKVLRHDLLGLRGFVPRSEDEQRRVVPHAFILIVGDEELIPARRIPTLAEDRHQRGMQATNHLIYIPKDGLVLADPALPLLEHTRVMTDFEIDETVRNRTENGLMGEPAYTSAPWRED